MPAPPQFVKIINRTAFSFTLHNCHSHPIAEICAGQAYSLPLPFARSWETEYELKANRPFFENPWKKQIEHDLHHDENHGKHHGKHDKHDKHGKHGKHDKHGKHGKHGKHDKHIDHIEREIIHDLEPHHEHVKFYLNINGEVNRVSSNSKHIQPLFLRRTLILSTSGYLGGSGRCDYYGYGYGYDNAYGNQCGIGYGTGYGCLPYSVNAANALACENDFVGDAYVSDAYVAERCYPMSFYNQALEWQNAKGRYNGGYLY